MVLFKLGQNLSSGSHLGTPLLTFTVKITQKQFERKNVTDLRRLKSATTGLGDLVDLI